MTPPLHARLTLLNAMGLHARAAASFVKAIKDLKVEVSVSWEGQTANGRSVLDLLILGAPRGSVLELQIQGDDAEEALSTLTRLVANRFDEE
ncbi:MAG: HPr family phosphocarrier protein [Desulfurellaceae bacterium]|nr:HPr family phosphocarrier protein [Desulfurellaceae bacterium]